MELCSVGALSEVLNTSSPEKHHKQHPRAWAPATWGFRHVWACLEGQDGTAALNELVLNEYRASTLYSQDHLSLPLSGPSRSFLGKFSS